MTTLYSPKGKKANPQSIMDRVKTFEDACEVLGLGEVEIGINGLDNHSKSIQAYAKLAIINQALNEDWKPDWTNDSQYKWFPYFNNASSSVGGFSCDDFVGWLTCTWVCSRLCFKSKELAEYAGKQFISEYNEFLSL